jgi:acid phosphatase (class B)
MKDMLSAAVGLNMQNRGRAMASGGIPVALLALLTASDATAIKLITISELANNLPSKPITVVFDVDDTALFTSGGFQWGTRTFGANIVSAGVPVRESDLKTDEEKRKYREFWTKMNNELDQFSVKKWIASELIAIHKSRGDKIYFVTRAHPTNRARFIVFGEAG